MAQDHGKVSEQVQLTITLHLPLVRFSSNLAGSHFKIKFLAVESKHIFSIINHRSSVSAEGNAHYPFSPGRKMKIF